MLEDLGRLRTRYRALAERLVRAMEAGDAAGGDRRGRQSAALHLVTTEDFPDINIRVDDHVEPLGGAELACSASGGANAGPGGATSPAAPIPPAGTDLDAIEAGLAPQGPVAPLPPLRLPTYFLRLVQCAGGEPPIK